MEKEELIELASQLSKPNGETGFAVAEKMNEGNIVMIDATIKELAPSPGETIVEIGPGNGKLSIPVIQAIGATGSYTGIEYSPEMATEADKNLTAAQSAQIQIIPGDCLQANITEQSVDGLFATNVLYFIEDLNTLFIRCYTWLKPNGRVVFAVRSRKVMEGLPFTEYGFRIRPIETIMEALSAAGFIGIGAKYLIDDPSKFVEETKDQNEPDDPSMGSIIITAEKQQ